MLSDILEKGKEEILEKFLYYMEQEGYGINDSQREIWKDSSKMISDTINYIFLNNDDKTNLKKLYKDQFSNICTYGIKKLLIQQKIKLTISKLIKILQCFRKAYSDIILQSNLGEKIKIEIVKFNINFFDELVCCCADVWNKTAESEIKFKALTELNSVFVFMYNNKKCIYLNTAAEKFTEYTKKEICNIDFKDIFDPKFQKYIINNVEKSEDIKNVLSTYEMKIITKSGKEKWIEFSKGLINFTDRPIMIGIAFDIDKRKKAEEDLKKSENRYRKLVELMPDSVLVHSNRKIEYCNKACAKLLGCNDPEEIIGKYNYKLMEIQSDYKSLYQQRMDRVLREGTVPLAEEKFIRKSDGHMVEVETTSTVIPYRDTVAILEILRNISERKRIEELKEKVKEKTNLLKQTIEYDKIRTEFFSNISHELKTPINVIFAALQLIELYEKKLKNNENEKYKIPKYVTIMKQNCYRLIRLVNNLIDITKIDAGYFGLNLKNCNIVSVVEEITLSVAEYIENHGIDLIFDTEIEEKIIACDKDKVERIILNLLSNAIKFTKPGGKICVNIYDKGDRILISVKDTGIGVPKEKQKDIFKRFVQVDKSLSRKREGSGIGLSLVKSLIEMHGGNISLKSECGKGSEFIIELPCRTINETQNQNNLGKYARNYNNIERIHIEFSDIYNNN
ncbi:PAS domain S-box protein [Haloimpatiens sp. FM7330]|uniref:PAS domain-containing sensor histidine kinase n=1 Tax=Haloimpatiens sp. FM7330 TaxID=3298610 RepID=UPI00363A3F42